MQEIKGMLEEWTQSAGELEELDALISLLAEEGEPDMELLAEAGELVERIEKWLSALKRKSLMGGETDENAAIVMVHSGAGGTESNDWTAMLFRMYQRWGENQGFQVNVMDHQPGEEAGIKSATFEIIGPYAYGNLKTETGVHRLVRLSPFDQAKRRHTSFASVFVYPEIDDSIRIDINDADLKIDTFRASGAGGQHVNTTDSAIRITHAPSGIVVQCQNERSQHKNKATAMKILRARLYEKERQERDAEKNQQNAQKQQIAFGSQIRSYILHPYQLVKDHRTEYETGSTQKVLDGGLDDFIEQALLMKVV